MSNYQMVSLLWLVAAFALLVGQVGCGGGGAAAQTVSAEEHAKAEEEANAPRGVKLGDFLTRDFHPISGEKSTLRYSVFGTVATAELEEFERLLINRQHKVRDQITTAARIVPMTDFDDPQLVNFRRRIVLRLRRALPELALQDVYITEFQFTVDK